jgi:Transglycosylase SLT domain/SPOR domain
MRSRSPVVSALLLACALTAAHSETPTAVPAPASPVTPAPNTLAPVNTVNVVCQRIESAALVNALPPEFLTRLIWQESRFNEHAISSAGAQGIAQFMPKTAEWVGLGDPFDASDAIGKSAALLRNLRAQFGNLGLAAAAYNAGPKRVSDWLGRRRTLPRETLNYVRIVTGHTADEWTTSAAVNLAPPNPVPCPEIIKLFAEHRDTMRGTLAPVPSTFPWGVQLIGGPSKTVALASFYQVQKTYRSLLGSYQPIVLSSPSGSWYRVRVGTSNRNQAEHLCLNLRAAGGFCLAQPN